MNNNVIIAAMQQINKSSCRMIIRYGSIYQVVSAEDLYGLTSLMHNLPLPIVPKHINVHDLVVILKNMKSDMPNGETIRQAIQFEEQRLEYEAASRETSQNLEQ